MLFSRANLPRLLAVTRTKPQPLGALIYRLSSSGGHSPRPNSAKYRLAALVASTALVGLAKLYADRQDWPRPLLAKEAAEAKEKLLVITPRQKLFFQFASVEYEGLPYMTPQDFLDSVTEDHPRPRMRRKCLTAEMVGKYLKATPARHHGSPRFFRDLEEKGLVSYSEYLFLLTVITSKASLRARSPALFV